MVRQRFDVLLFYVTAAELLVSVCYIFLMYRMEGIWIRGYFVLVACVLVFIYALNAGALSRLLSLRMFTMFASKICDKMRTTWCTIFTPLIAGDTAK